MTKEKVNWDDIPSLEGLEVDWQFEPENPLGKRAWSRIANIELFKLLGVKNIAVKVVAKNLDGQGALVDLTQSGLGVLLDTKLAKNQQVQVGFFLGKQKILSRALVRNVRDEDGRHRTGIEFVGLNKEYDSFIAGLIASTSYTSEG